MKLTPHYPLMTEGRVTSIVSWTTAVQVTTGLTCILAEMISNLIGLVCEGAILKVNEVSSVCKIKRAGECTGSDISVRLKTSCTATKVQSVLTQ